MKKPQMRGPHSAIFVPLPPLAPPLIATHSRLVRHPVAVALLKPKTTGTTQLVKSQTAVAVVASSSSSSPSSTAVEMLEMEKKPVLLSRLMLLLRYEVVPTCWWASLSLFVASEGVNKDNILP